MQIIYNIHREEYSDVSETKLLIITTYFDLLSRILFKIKHEYNVCVSAQGNRFHSPVNIHTT